MKLKLFDNYRPLLMGIATIWICVFHGIGVFEYYPNDPSQLAILTNMIFGSIGVEIFLILSGIANYESLCRNNSTIMFYKRKLKRIIPAATVICVLFWGFKDFYVYNSGIGTFLVDLFGISFWIKGEIRFWYLWLILLCYLISPLLYRITPKVRKCILVGTIILPMIYELWNYQLFERTEIAICRLSSYIIGFIIGEKVQANKGLNTVDILGILVFAIACQFLRFFHLRSIMRFTRLPMALVICLIIMILGEKIKSKKWPSWTTAIAFKIKNTISLIGQYSLEMYIIQVSLIWICINYLNFNLTSLVNYLIIMLLTFLLSVTTNKLCKWFIHIIH